MPLNERLPLTYVNGQTFFEGFVSFFVVFAAVLIVGQLIRRFQENELQREAEEQEQEEVNAFLAEHDDYFDKIEDYRNDFR